MSLKKNQTDNLVNHYSRTFNLWEINKKITEIVQKYGNDHFRLYQLVCCTKREIKIIEIKNNRFVYKTPSKKEQTSLEELQKSIFIKVINKRKIPEPIYDDEIMFKVVVYK